MESPFFAPSPHPPLYDFRLAGILVQLPLPGHINEQKVLDLILPDKVRTHLNHSQIEA
jgi:5,10-methylene-tetrahydrofolate dehydrogenase/methenyl tetrahydrofolate cyclohydrolase